MEKQRPGYNEYLRQRLLQRARFSLRGNTDHDGIIDAHHAESELFGG